MFCIIKIMLATVFIKALRRLKRKQGSLKVELDK